MSALKMRLCSFMRACVFVCLSPLGGSLGGGSGWVDGSGWDCVFCFSGVFVFVSFWWFRFGSTVWVAPAFRSLLVQWLFFSRPTRTLADQSSGSWPFGLLACFGSLLVLRFSARPLAVALWPLALLSEVGLAVALFLRWALWTALVLQPLRTCAAFSSLEATFEDFVKFAALSAIAPWDSFGNLPPSGDRLVTSLFGCFSRSWPLLAWVVRASWVRGHSPFFLLPPLG